MAEAAATVISIAAPTLHAIRVLIVDIKAIKDAPKNLRNLLGDLGLVEISLKSIESVDKKQWTRLGTTTLDLAKATIKRTEETLLEANKELLRYKETEKISKRDRGVLGFWKKSDLDTISAQLHICQGSITSLITTATLYSCITNTQTTKEMTSIISTSQAQISTSLMGVNQRLAEVERQLKERLIFGTETKGNNEITSSRVSREREDLGVARQLLQCLLAQIQKVADNVEKENARNEGTYSISFGDNNKGLQLGVNEGIISSIQFGGMHNSSY